MDAQTPAIPGAPAAGEDWSRLPVAGSGLKIADVVIAQPDIQPTFTRTMIQITWRLNDPIYLFLILPKDHPKPPVIIYLYGFPADTDRFMNDKYCALLAKDGFAAVGFVSALTGPRYHDRGMKEWFVSELPEAIGATVHDVQMILNYLTLRNDVDIDHVGMFGEGSGASIAILTAAVDQRIKALDVTDPWGDWPQWLAKSKVVPDEERAEYLKPEFLKRVAPLDPVHWFGKVKAAVRLQFLYDPDATPAAAAERIIEAAPPQSQIVPHKEALARFQADKFKFFDWVKEQLRPQSR